MVKVSCSFIGLIGVGVGGAHVGCTPDMAMVFLGAGVPGTVGATVG